MSCPRAVSTAVNTVSSASTARPAARRATRGSSRDRLPQQVRGVVHLGEHDQRTSGFLGYQPRRQIAAHAGAGARPVGGSRQVLRRGRLCARRGVVLERVRDRDRARSPRPAPPAGVCTRRAVRSCDPHSHDLDAAVDVGERRGRARRGSGRAGRRARRRRHQGTTPLPVSRAIRIAPDPSARCSACRARRRRPDANVGQTDPLPTPVLDGTVAHAPRAASPASTGISPAAMSRRTSAGSAASSAIAIVGGALTAAAIGQAVAATRAASPRGHAA